MMAAIYYWLRGKEEGRQPCGRMISTCFGCEEKGVKSILCPRWPSGYLPKFVDPAAMKMVKLVEYYPMLRLNITVDSVGKQYHQMTWCQRIAIKMKVISMNTGSMR